MALIGKYQNSFTTGIISPALYSRIDLAKYNNGLKQLTNMIVQVHGGVTKRPGTQYIDTVTGDNLEQARLIPFSYNTEQTYVLLFLDYKMRIYRNGGVVLNPDTLAIAECTTPYAIGELATMKFAQSADTMFIAHPSHPPMKMVRTDHHVWTFSEVVFEPEIQPPADLTASATDFTDSSNTYIDTTTYYKVSAVSELEVESEPSDYVSAATLSTWPSGARVTLTWSAVADAKRYEVYKKTSGFYYWIGYADECSFIDDYIEGDTGSGPKENQYPFEAAGDYPGCVGFFQQRLAWGRTNNDPQTIWFSELGALNSMATSTPLRDDDAITVTLDSRQMNEIRHFINLRDMIILTSGAEFMLDTNSSALTPTTVGFETQSQWGCSDIPPLIVGTSIVVIQNDKRNIRDAFYQINVDGYSGELVSILAEHLFDSDVKSWAYQQSPFSTIYIVLESGKLLTFTYMRDQEVFAWAEHETQGDYRAVTSIRDDKDDAVYFLVERDGEYFVEYQVRREYGDDLEDAFFVDCGASYEGDATLTVSGLTWLKGREVVALADGSVVTGLTVSNDGGIVLPQEASKIHVGLPYTATMETLNMEFSSSEGYTLGQKKNVEKAQVQLRESRDLQIGYDEEHLNYAKMPYGETYGDAPPMYSGTLNLVLQGKHRDEITVVIRHDTPTPITVLGLNLSISVG